jgi:hypothetical protein
VDTENQPTLLQSLYREAGLELMGDQVIDSLCEQQPDNHTESEKPSSTSNEVHHSQLPETPLEWEAMRAALIINQLGKSLFPMHEASHSDPASDPPNRETSE